MFGRSCSDVIQSKSEMFVAGIMFFGVFFISIIMSVGIVAGKEEASDAITFAIVSPGGLQAAENFQIKWTGPNFKKDFIAIAKPEMKADKYLSWAYTSNGNPAQMRAPTKPGTYEIRYINGSDNQILARGKIEVKPSNAEIKKVKPVTAAYGLEIDWVGPNIKKDFIAIAKPEMKGNRYLSWVYTSNGSPAKMRVPSKPGTYEIRYINGSDEQILVRTSLIVEPGNFKLEVPDKLVAGYGFDVKWTGPNFKKDFIAIAKPDMKGNQHLSWVYTSNGNPAKMRAPSKPGTYEVRYVNGNDEQILVRLPLKIKSSGVTVEVK